MLRLKTFIAASSISGIGLFAGQVIRAGTVTWEYDAEFDSAFTAQVLQRMPEVCREDFLKYAYFDHVRDRFVLCCDNQRFINHSADPNIISTPDRDTAARDIAHGEELTCDYSLYEHDWFERRGVDRRLLDGGDST